MKSSHTKLILGALEQHIGTFIYILSIHIAFHNINHHYTRAIEHSRKCLNNWITMFAVIFANKVYNRTIIQFRIHHNFFRMLYYGSRVNDFILLEVIVLDISSYIVAVSLISSHKYTKQHCFIIIIAKHVYFVKATMYSSKHYGITPNKCTQNKRWIYCAISSRELHLSNILLLSIYEIGINRKYSRL